MGDWPSMTEDEMKSALADASTADRIDELEADLAAMTSRYSRAATDIASLEAQLAEALRWVGDMFEAWCNDFEPFALGALSEMITAEEDAIRAAIDAAREPQP